ncbi:lysylphosphatidylglycerol synthase transmembrane domain-containing protein [Mycolicibacterium austroafricanum]|uniref:lysylphosphatidylglycerol synthase transmembrane domain-containing protein n=1 Tax=Mycolicibacterium austroafricanum TaxID=39687 RepID=UPI001CA327EC|nr:YbhN family protein [Mycolicibacterium austroafricanum]QZT63067.1 YbhN family protein [Mycolicibacterium austroafricanum]
MSHDAPASDAPAGPAGPDRSRGKYWWLRWALIALAVIVLTVELALVRDQLAKAWKSLLTADWLWVLAAAVAAMASMHSFAQIQRTLLRSAGVRVLQWRSEAAFYAGNALSTTLPGGPVLSATFIYRQQRLWGASPLVASWQLVMSGALQVIGLALLGLGGAFLLGARENPLSLIFSLGGFVALILLAQAVATRPELLDGIGARVLRWINSVRGKPTRAGLAKWREILTQLESVQLSRRDLGEAFSWSLFNWIADVACLLFACFATGGHPSLAGVTVAYAAARAVGSIPLMPGGLLVVEAVLVPGLVSSGMSLASAISAMLIYRLISWIFISAIGWVVFFFMFRTAHDVEPDPAAASTATPAEDVAPQLFSPDPDAFHPPDQKSGAPPEDPDR